jgi:hypothetical protein
VVESTVMTDATKDLCRILEASGARVSLDPERNFTLPCVICGMGDNNYLVVVGSYIVTTAGGMFPREPMERPVCESCSMELPGDPT